MSPSTTRVPRRHAPLLAAAGQLALIIVGVYLGLWAEEWRERRRDAELTRASLVAFREEVQRNRGELARNLAYHREVSDRLADVWKRHVASGQALSFAVLRSESGYDGTRFADCTTSAYDLALATQSLHDVSVSLALDLSRAYEHQRVLNRYQEQVAADLLGAAPDARGDWTRTAYVLAEGIAETRNHEIALIAQYDDLLRHLRR
ncbi:MAG: hypothetical protein JO180_02050 [Gemmatirosa sp.]|nr:hypothetical protein [Gemmatirosa sp.]